MIIKPFFDQKSSMWIFLAVLSTCFWFFCHCCRCFVCFSWAVYWISPKLLGCVILRSCRSSHETFRTPDVFPDVGANFSDSVSVILKGFLIFASFLLILFGSMCRSSLWVIVIKKFYEKIYVDVLSLLNKLLSSYDFVIKITYT